LTNWEQGRSQRGLPPTPISFKVSLLKLGLIVDGISEKVALTIHAIAMFFTAFIIAFVKQWKMTLVLICIIPALGIPIVVTTTIMQKHEKRSLDHYAEGATLAEEVISTVRVAHAFGTQERLLNKYDTHLNLAEKSGSIKSIVIAIQMFSIFFVIYAVCSQNLQLTSGGRIGILVWSEAHRQWNDHRPWDRHHVSLKWISLTLVSSLQFSSVPFLLRKSHRISKHLLSP
jgi:ABC-type multidrug transport system fused ATPase/permease subunit